MPSTSTLIIVNPAAAGGSARKIWEKSFYQVRSVLGAFETVITCKPGHATDITREAITSGYQKIIGFGGDGTLNEIINGFFESHEPLNPDAKIGMLTQGTGRDLSRSLKLSRDLNRALEHIREDQSRTIDVGYVHYHTNEHHTEGRYFANISSFGLGGEVDLLMKERFQKLGWNGSIAYLTAILTSLARYRNPSIELSVDGDPVWEGPIRNVAVANGRYFGGGLQIAPEADLQDGLLDVVIIGEVGVPYLLRHAHYFYQGRHSSLNGISCYKGKQIEVQGPGRTHLDIDGEPVGRLPATFSVVPNALNIIA